MFCSNRALLYVDYPTQVLAKSCKPIPVMVMGLLVFRRKYSLVKYLCVFMVAAGIALFMMPSGGPSHRASETSPTTLGILLLLGSLALDGLTGPFQDELIKTYKPSSPHLMFYSNLWASVVMFVVVIGIDDLQPALEFCMRNPEVIQQIGLFFSLQRPRSKFYILHNPPIRGIDMHNSDHNPQVFHYLCECDLVWP